MAETHPQGASKGGGRLKVPQLPDNNIFDDVVSSGYINLKSLPILLHVQEK